MSFSVVMLALTALGVGGGLAFYQMKHGNEILVLEKCCDDILLGPKTALFVRAETEVRSKPSFEQGRTVYTYTRGITVNGEVVLGPDGKTRWLKQAGDGWFVLTKDLSTGAPPRLMAPASEKQISSPASLKIHQIPDDRAPILVTLAAGSVVTLVGKDKNGYTEVVFDHPVYRVGYVKGLGR
jgi:hypothetical protein